MAAILHNCDGIGTRRYTAICGKRDQARGRHVFEFGRHCCARLAEFAQRVGVVVLRLHMHVGHLPGRAFGIGVEHHDPVAHRARGNREHAAELTAAQYAQRSARHNRDSAESRARQYG